MMKTLKAMIEGSESVQSMKYKDWISSDEEHTISRMLTMCLFINKGLVLINKSEHDATESFHEGELIESSLHESEELLHVSTKAAFLRSFPSESSGGRTDGTPAVPFAVGLASSFLEDIDSKGPDEAESGPDQSGINIFEEDSAFERELESLTVS